MALKGLPDLLWLQGAIASTVPSAFQTSRLVAVGSISGISMIVLQWPDWPPEEHLRM